MFHTWTPDGTWESLGGFLTGEVYGGTVDGGAFRVCALGADTQSWYMKEYTRSTGWAAGRVPGRIRTDARFRALRRIPWHLSVPLREPARVNRQRESCVARDGASLAAVHRARPAARTAAGEEAARLARAHARASARCAAEQRFGQRSDGLAIQRELLPADVFHEMGPPTRTIDASAAQRDAAERGAVTWRSRTT